MRGCAGAVILGLVILGLATFLTAWAIGQATGLPVGW